VESNSQVATALHKSVEAQKQHNQKIGIEQGRNIGDVLDDIDDNRDDTREYSARLGFNGGDEDADITDYGKMGMDDILAALDQDTTNPNRLLSADVMLAMNNRKTTVEFPADLSKLQSKSVTFPDTPVKKMNSTHMQ
jgi:hypothetical protein